MEAGPIAVRVGDLLIGVRTNDDEMTALLRAALRPHVEAHVDAPPNLSLTFGETEGRVRGMHFLYRSGVSVARTTSRGRLLRATLRQVQGYGPPPAGTTSLNARLLLRGDAAVLVDGRFGGTVDIVERRLHRIGYRMVDVPGPLLDRETLEVRIQGPSITVDRDGRAEIDRRDPPGRHEVELHEARYRLGGVVVWGEPEPDGLSPAQRYAELTALATRPDGTIVPDDLDTLARVTSACDIARIGFPDAKQLLRELRTLSS